MALFFLLWAGSVHAVDNYMLTILFENYEKTIDEFLAVAVTGNWAGSELVAQEIRTQSAHMKALAEGDGNMAWLFDVTNVWNHAGELLTAVRQKELVSAIKLVCVLEAHLGYIQANNPLWLREHIRKQLTLIEQGIAARDHDATRDAAEATHVSGNRIVLSAGLQSKLYKDTEWVDDVTLINAYGDAIIHQVNGGDWVSPVAELEKIKRAFDKWDASFKD